MSTGRGRAVLRAVSRPPGPRSPLPYPRKSSAPPAATSVNGAGVNGADTEEQLRVREAAEVLRGQLARPGGYHRPRAAGIAERLMGVRLGAAQEEALGVWGEVYGMTSGTLHGGVADPARAAALYRKLLAAARELLVPLPGRAARVLELAALKEPGEAQARERLGGPARHRVLLPFRPGRHLAPAP
ncbi:hypothetical protein [Streptomyces sp. NPDC052721]|uniref:hypothetical protein n=1 Tax=Streptomyces sp. NPDC052721 TaxID=3154955 RepID=UPI0034223EA6